MKKIIVTVLFAVTCLFYTDAEAKSKKKPKAPPPVAAAALETPAAEIAPPLQLPAEIHYTLEMLGIDLLYRMVGFNRHGEIAANKDQRGVFINRQDQVTMFDCLQFDRPDERYTTPVGINNDGTITGGCASGTFGFVRRKGGQLYQFSFPGADGTHPAAMNDWEEVIGEYYNPFTPVMNSGWYRFHSFLRLTDGSYQVIAAPPHSDDHGAPNSLTRTVVTAINNRRQIVGTYETIFTPSNTSGMWDSFLWSNGQFTDLPRETWPISINNDGQILMQTMAGYAIYDNGRLLKLHPPVGYLWSGLLGLNDLGQLIGFVREDVPPVDGHPIVRYPVIATPIR